MRTLLLVALVLQAVSLASPVPARATVWDDFNAKSKKLDSSKWLGDELVTGGVVSEEIQRLIAGGKLLMAHRAVGDSGSGVSGVRLVFRNTSPFTSIQYDVKPVSFNTADCGGPVSTASQQQFNFLFNTDSISTCPTGSPMGTTCDVFAIFYLDRVSSDPANMVRVHARVIARPTDGGAEVILGSIAEFGLVKKGTKMNLKTTWDEGAHTVTFQQTIKKAQTTIPVDYGMAADDNGGAALNTIEVDDFICGAGGEADASATWDNIIVTP